MHWPGRKMQHWYNWMNILQILVGPGFWSKLWNIGQYIWPCHQRKLFCLQDHRNQNLIKYNFLVYYIASKIYVLFLHVSQATQKLLKIDPGFKIF